jgi:hypothetical protein
MKHVLFIISRTQIVEILDRLFDPFGAELLLL